jgi:hypothetical protein
VAVRRLFLSLAVFVGFQNSLLDFGIAGPSAQAETGSELQSTEPAPTPSWDQIAKTANSSLSKICPAIEAAAKENSLPVRFFTRLIWQESRFDPSQVSPAGAQGIAQFMPPTAAARGLADPFDPVVALQESASYLRELRNTFGNLGLAAAAYNAGAYRVSRWLSHAGSLPDETVDYVQIVTGRSVEEWAAADAAKWDKVEFPDDIACGGEPQSVGTTPGSSPTAMPPPLPMTWKPWGVQLIGAWNQGSVLATFERLRRQYAVILADHEPLILRVRPDFASVLMYEVRVAEDSRQSANQLCKRLRAAGCPCDVLRNPPARR